MVALANRTTVVLGVMVMLVAVVPPAFGADGFDGDSSTTERVNTSNPTTAANAISRDRFPEEHSADYAILSRDDVFADSLAASGLNNDGPLLFTKTNILTEATKNELHRVLSKGQTIYLLGGKFAISEEVEAHLQDLGWETTRLAGATRLETSVKIADEIRRLTPDVNTAIVARAFGTPDDETSGWVDSIAGGAWAAHRRVPILVTHKEQLDAPARDWLNHDNPSTTYLLGGTHALSEQVEDQAPNPKRVAGADRAGTAVEIAKQLWGITASGPRQFVILNGYADNGWAFGLAGAGAASKGNAPTLIVAYDIVSTTTADMVSSCDTEQVDLLLLGDTSVISSDVEATLDAQDGRSCSDGDGGTGGDDGGGGSGGTTGSTSWSCNLYSDWYSCSGDTDASDYSSESWSCNLYSDWLSCSGDIDKSDYSSESWTCNQYSDWYSCSGDIDKSDYSSESWTCNLYSDWWSCSGDIDKSDYSSESWTCNAYSGWYSCSGDVNKSNYSSESWTCNIYSGWWSCSGDPGWLAPVVDT